MVGLCPLFELSVPFVSLLAAAACVLLRETRAVLTRDLGSAIG